MIFVSNVRPGNLILTDDSYGAKWVVLWVNFECLLLYAIKTQQFFVGDEGDVLIENFNDAKTWKFIK